MKGKIKLESKENEGTTFIIKIPLSNAKVEKQEVVFMTDKYQGKVLVADDEPDLREILELLLTEKRCEVQSVSNGQEAYDLYIQNPENFDLIITDMQMPKMGGIDLIKALRSNTKIKQPKVAVITGCIYKPFEDKNLKQVLDNSLK